jgi:hypothetical protein
MEVDAAWWPTVPLSRGCAMRRKLWWALPAAGAAAVGGWFALVPSAHSAKVGANGEGAGGPTLPITRVALFSAGVGHFVREGEVEGDARVDLSFPARDVNDLLKSLVVQDLGGGTVAAVSYDAQDPAERTLKSYAVDLTGSPPFSRILTQLRGEKVEAQLTQAAAGQPQVVTGAVIGVEAQKVPSKDGSVEEQVLNLWCADGARALKLSEVQRLRFLSPAIEAEFRKALETLAQSHDAQRKSVRVSFSGNGRRPVSVGYVAETPVWKTSYRLVLPAENARKNGDADKGGADAKPEAGPYLQGWAVVENPSDEDWSGVRVALVSGRPVAFRMDLYQPLYAPRPMEQLDLFAGLRPPSFDGAMEDRPAAAPKPARPLEAAPAAPGLAAAKDSLSRRGLLRQEQAARKAGADAFSADKERDKMDETLELGLSVRTGASAERLGDSFRYVVAQPVTLPRQKSALLPIAGEEVKARRLSVYDAAVHPRHPMLGLMFTAPAGLPLVQGPVTVFEGSVYAGDAKLPDLQPGEQRLVAYAVDLGCEVEKTHPKGQQQRLTRVVVKRGLLETTHRLREEAVYNIKNRSDHARTVWVEHPYRAEMQLISEAKPVERSARAHRFELAVAAGKTGTLNVAEERDVAHSYQLTNVDDGTIRFFLQQAQASPKVKEGLAQVLARKEKLQRATQDIAEVDRELKRIADDQERLRKNLREMPEKATAYPKYLAKFDAQETEIDKLTERLKSLRVEESKLRKELDAFLLGLDLS